MKFRTEFEALRSPMTLHPGEAVVLAGSCFSQNIAQKMNQSQWEAVTPLGTLYNPHSIFLALDMMLDEKEGLQRFEKSLFSYQDIWHSSRFDSSFSSRHRDDCLQEFQNRKNLFINTLSRGKTLILTFGTSIVYHYKSDRCPAANCHKLPQDLFYTQRMTPSEILSFASVVIEQLQERFPGIRVIFTVSPVRHLKNGFSGNARSKAVLLLGVEDIIQYNEGTYYFPAYEIMNDDLRDYRFYAQDLTHPSQEAIDYIWEKFTETYLDEEGIQLLREGEKTYRRLHHRPLTGALGKPLESTQGDI